MSSGGLDLEQVHISVDNRGPIVNIVAWIFLVSMLLAVITRVALKFTATHRAGLDDALIVLAMCASIGQTVASSMQVSQGLGQRQDSLSAYNLEHFQKTGYAADFLFFPTLTLSKLSILHFIMKITPDKRWARLLKAMAVVIGTWGLTGTLVIAFGCGFPNPWGILKSTCYNPTAFWCIYGLIDVLSEVSIISVPVCLVWNLKMTFNRKSIVVIAFSFRVMCIILAIFRVASITSAMGSADRTFSLYKPAILSIVLSDTSIVVSCIPLLNIFMDNLQSGLFTHEVQKGKFISSAPGSGYAMQNLTSSGSRSRSGSRSLCSAVAEQDRMKQQQESRKGSVATTGGKSLGGGMGSKISEEEEIRCGSDSQSLASHGSQKRIINVRSVN